MTGRVITIYVRDNQAVKKGDLLFEIDPSVYELKVRQAEARLRRTEENAKALKIEYERVQKIYAQDPGAASQKDLNRNRVSYYKALVDIDGAKESLNKARLDLERTKVKAEVDGWVSNINFQVGSQAVEPISRCWRWSPEILSGVSVFSVKMMSTASGWA